MQFIGAETDSNNLPNTQLIHVLSCTYHEILCSRTSSNHNDMVIIMFYYPFGATPPGCHD